MTIASWPFENADTSETQYSYLFREFSEPGVVGVPGDASLRVTATTGLGLQVANGRALARGYMLAVTAPEALTCATANASLARIDRVVARFDPTANAGTLAILTGTPGAAQPPALTQTDTGVFEFSLARVAVAAGQTTLSAADITNERTYTGTTLRSWTSDTRPTERLKGRTLGYNETSAAYEFWNGSTWAPLAPTWATLAGKPTTSTIDGRTIFVDDKAPTNSQGANGDIWLEW